MYNILFKQILEKFPQVDRILAFCYDNKSSQVRFHSTDDRIRLSNTDSPSLIRDNYQLVNEPVWGKIMYRTKFMFHSSEMFPCPDDNIFLVRVENLFDKKKDIFFFSYELKKLNTEESREIIIELLPSVFCEIIKANMLCYRKSVINESQENRQNLYIGQLEQKIRKYEDRVLRFAKSIVNEYRASKGVAVLMDDAVERKIISYTGAIEQLADALQHAIDYECEKNDREVDFIKLTQFSLILNDSENVPSKEQNISNNGNLSTQQRKTITWLNRLEDGLTSLINDPYITVGERVSGNDLARVCNITAAAISDKLSQRNETHLINILSEHPNEWPLLRRKLRRLEILSEKAKEKRKK
ncbi:MAG: hypothetical protein LBH92_04965 [Bacteroidales bacterium]|jgi:hypothetical protein|nr:hypothetical protein [Bacteroidales bacterium]